MTKTERRLLLGVAGGLAVLAVLVAITFTRVLDVSSQATANQRVDTGALCTLRHDLQTRVDSSERFLVNHPHGFAGISAATIRSGIANELRTIAALSTITCNN